MVIALLFACSPDLGAEVPPTERLVRVSLDVRGIRPSLEELGRVTADPGQLEPMIDGFLDHDGFAGRVKDLFAPGYRTRVDAYPFTEDRPELDRAIGEEPLNLIAAVAMEERPYTDIVLSDHTVVHDALLDWWPLEVVAAGPLPGTSVARYTDGRPHVGVLSTNAMWWRHESTFENANRGRANALSRALLCESFLDRPIDFPRDIDLSDSETIRSAIQTNPGCTACHASLDPIASYLWGFMYRGEDFESWSTYAVSAERDWVTATGRAPGWFGTPGSNLPDLGVFVARDPRFVSCAVKRVYEGLLGRRARVDDDGALAEHRDAFIVSGLDLKSLVRSVLDDERYRGLRSESAFGGTPEDVELKVITPEQLSTELYALTGFRMTDGEDGPDALAVDYGLRALAGGSDQGAATSPSTGLVLVHRRLAEAAASAIVEGAVSGGAVTSIVSDWSASPTPEQLVDLVAVTASVRIPADGPEVAELGRLWQDLAEAESPDTAWRGLLTALLADPQRLVY